MAVREAERVLGREADAQDAAQEALARAWRRAHTCADRARPGPWVRAIAQREALRIVLRPREAPLESVPEPPAIASEELVLTRMAVRAAVARLPEGDRRLLHAVYWEDATGRDASRRAGLEDVTARVRLHRLRRALERPVGHALGRVG